MHNNLRQRPLPVAIHVALIAAFSTFTILGARPGDAIRAATGVSEGLYVHLGCGNGETTVGLTDGNRILVHGLAKSNSDFDAARARVAQSNLEGMVTIERATTWNPLPYSQQLVNCVVADLDALGSSAPPMDEMKRILAPLGVLYTRKGGTWSTYRKSIPSTMDEWTHYDHGPDGNPYSRDQHMNPATSAQWIGGYWTRAGRANNMRVSGGKCTYFRKFEMKGVSSPTGNSHLVSRDAFSGVLLWRKPAGWLERGGSMVMAGDTVFTILGGGSNLVAISASTGKLLRAYTSLPKLTSKDKKNTDLSLIYEDGVLYLGYEANLYAVEASTGKVKWTYTEGEGTWVYYPRTASSSDAVYALITSGRGWNLHNHSHWAVWRSKALVSIDKETGKSRWRQTEVGPVVANLVYSPGNGIYSFVQRSKVNNAWVDGHMTCYSEKDGSKTWHLGLPKHGAPYHKLEAMAIGDGFGLAFSDRYMEKFNLATGKKEAKANYVGVGLCMGGFLTPNFLFTGFGNHYDLKNNKQFTTSHTILGCNERPYPAYGMMFMGEAGCKCYYPFAGVKASSSEPFGKIIPDANRLEKGAALGKAPGLAKAQLCSPCYEYSPMKSGGVNITASPIRDDWSSNDAFPGATASTSGGGVTYTTHVHQQKVVATKDGKTLWTFRAGGRINNAPVISGGKCLFGSNDGWVYCLDAGSGKAAWRFMAAPYDKKMVAYSQVESTWPVMGVVVSNGKVYATAGRHPELNGGIWAYGLNIGDGSIAWKSRATRKQMGWHDGTKTVSGGTGGRPQLNAVNAVPKISGGSMAIPGIKFSLSNGTMSAGSSYTTSGPFDLPLVPVYAKAQFEILPVAPVGSINIGYSHFVLPRPGKAFVAMYDAQGRIVEEIYDGLAPAGRTNIKTPAPGAGVRFLRLHALGQSTSRSLLHL